MQCICVCRLSADTSHLHLTTVRHVRLTAIGQAAQENQVLQHLATRREHAEVRTAELESTVGAIEVLQVMASRLPPT